MTITQTFAPADLSPAEERAELRRVRDEALILARRRRSACRGVNLAQVMQEPPRGLPDPAPIARTLITHASSPFDHVIDVDECGAPILAPEAPITCENQA